MAFAILRATNLCLRGSRKKWRSGTGMDDGADLPFSEEINFLAYVYCVYVISLVHIFPYMVLVFSLYAYLPYCILFLSYYYY